MKIGNTQNGKKTKLKKFNKFLVLYNLPKKIIVNILKIKFLLSSRNCLGTLQICSSPFLKEKT
jgi:hypothetical protein